MITNEVMNETGRTEKITVVIQLINKNFLIELTHCDGF